MSHYYNKEFSNNKQTMASRPSYVERRRSVTDWTSVHATTPQVHVHYSVRKNFCIKKKKKNLLENKMGNSNWIRKKKARVHARAIPRHAECAPCPLKMCMDTRRWLLQLKNVFSSSSSCLYMYWIIVLRYEETRITLKSDASLLLENYSDAKRRDDCETP